MGEDSSLDLLPSPLNSGTENKTTLPETGACKVNSADNVLGFAAEELEMESSRYLKTGTAISSLKSDVSEQDDEDYAKGRQENVLVSCFDSETAAEKGTESGASEINAINDDPFLQSVKYLEKHQILRLFQNFAARIVYKRPDNPFHFLIDELEKSKREKEQSTSTS